MVYQITSPTNWIICVTNAPSKEDEEKIFTNEEDSSDLDIFSCNSNELIQQDFTSLTESDFLNKNKLIWEKVERVFFHLLFAIDRYSNSYSKTFFISSVFENPSLKTDVKKWSTIFGKIEDRINKVFSEVIYCIDPIAACYALECGFPEPFVKVVYHQDSINFGDEILQSEDEIEYLSQLSEVAKSKIPNFFLMMSENRKWIEKLQASHTYKEIGNQITDQMKIFIADKITKIRQKIMRDRDQKMDSKTIEFLSNLKKMKLNIR